MELIQQQRISENTEKFLLITLLVSKEWISEQIKNIHSPPLIWMLTDNAGISYQILERLEQSLHFLDFEKLTNEQLLQIRNKLKSNGKENVFGIISELDIYAFLVENSIPFEYEPIIPGHKGRVDFSIRLENENILIEVTTLSQSDKDEKFDKSRTQLTEKIKGIELPYHISFGIKELIPISEIKKIKNYVYKAMLDGKEGELLNPFPFLTKIRLKKYQDLKRVIIGTHWSGVEDLAPHIRNVLNKKTNQLSKEHKNIIIINLLDYADEYFFYNAISGDEVMNFFIALKPDAKLPEPYLSRKNKDRFLQKNFNTRVNCVVGYRYFFNSQKWIGYHPKPNKSFTDIEKQKLSDLFS